MKITDKNFEKYRGGPTLPAAERLHVTVGRWGRFYFNKAVHARLGRPDAINMYYSREENEIAIEAADAHSPEAMPLFTDRKGWRVNAAPFCRYFGIRFEATEKFLRPEFREGILMLRVADRTVVTKRRRSHNRSDARS